VDGDSVRYFTIIGAAIIPLAALAQGLEPFAMSKSGEISVYTAATGAAMPVLPGVMGARPPNCPEGRFYAVSANVLASCDDNSRFELVPAVSAKYPAGALLLKRIPKPGTDDPGPMQR